MIRELLWFTADLALQADWFAKHRKRRPAVAVLLLER